MVSDTVTGIVVSNNNGLTVCRQVFSRARLHASICETIGRGCSLLECGPSLPRHITYVDEEGIYSNTPHPNVIFMNGLMWHGKIVIFGACDSSGAETDATLSPQEVRAFLDVQT